MSEPQTADDPDAARALRIYRDMVLIRRFEEKVGQLFGMGLIDGECPLSIGQEAVAVGLEAAMGPGDRRTAGPRCHGQMLACGIEPHLIMAELLGRTPGLSDAEGRASPTAFPAHGFYGGHAVPGAQVPFSVSLALTPRHFDDGRVTLCCLGVGEAAQAQVCEAWALAVSRSLPVIFVIENNAETWQTPETGSSVLRDAIGFGMQGAAVDGADVVQVRAAAIGAVARCRSGAGPSVIEACTSRFRGHTPEQTETERPDDRHRRAQRDPLLRMADWMRSRGLVDNARLRQTEHDIRDIVANAAAFARAASAPDTAPT